MPDRSRIARLARFRVPAGFFCGALVLWLAQPTPATLAWGTGIALCGEALRVWASGHLHKSQEVTMSGPYRWFAHPLYVGSSVMGAGLACASNRLAAAIVIAAYLGVMITAAIRSEEAHLERRFGDRYARYRQGQGGAAAGAALRRFSVSQAVLNREHRTIAGLVLVLLLLVLKATYNGLFWRS